MTPGSMCPMMDSVRQGRLDPPVSSCIAGFLSLCSGRRREACQTFVSVLSQRLPHVSPPVEPPAQASSADSAVTALSEVRTPGTLLGQGILVHFRPFQCTINVLRVPLSSPLTPVQPVMAAGRAFPSSRPCTGACRRAPPWPWSTPLASRPGPGGAKRLVVFVYLSQPKATAPVMVALDEPCWMVSRAPGCGPTPPRVVQ
jgi:hypothetical protein